VRYDERGCGLSDHDVVDVSLDAHVADLEAVADAAGFERFALIGVSQGGALAVSYAARHPERVSHLVLVGAFAKGVLKRDVPETVKETARLTVQLIRLGWDQANPAFNQLFTTQMMPDATAEVARRFNEMQRLSTSPEQAARLIAASAEFDASAALPLVRCPTLVFHARADARVPFEEGCRLASGIAGARFVPLDSRNHVLLHDEPAWAVFASELRAFLSTGPQRTAPQAFSALTPKVRKLLDHLARRLDNAQIAAHLGLAQKTVRNTITRVFEKLGVESRAQAIVRAREAGFGQR